MNILKPKLMWVSGRCYRLLPSSEWLDTHSISCYVENDYDLDHNNYEEEYHDPKIKIVACGATKFKHTFHVAKSFFPHIIGSKNATRKKLETDTKTIIKVPKMKKEGDIVIIGSDHKGIMIARHRINLLMEAVRKKLRKTHFLSIPLNESCIITEFDAFKYNVLTNFGKTTRGIDEMIFQTPNKLHLTIGVLTLLDDEERNEAIKALNYCKEYIIKPILEGRQINIYLEGTDIMNDDPSMVDVLYAKVKDTEGVLQQIVDKIANYYNSIDLSMSEHERVHLHATLMNKKWKQDKDDLKRKPKSSCTFDATEILKAYENTFFGETTFKEIHISERHTTDLDGYYRAIAKIIF